MMNITYKKPSELKPYPNNPRLNDDAVDKLARSISEFGFRQPIVVDQDNMIIVGPNYDFFVPRRIKQPPIILNTRIYSCNLIRNDTPYRWRGRYNEDTDLSLRMLKDGWCTILFNAFLQKKASTQTLKGGNTDDFYSKEGTLPKSQMLVNLHPDVSRLVWRFNRWHHYVDYNSFKNIKLVKKENVEIKTQVDNYGMKLTNRKDHVRTK